jgi:hypothetical protein
MVVRMVARKVAGRRTKRAGIMGEVALPVKGRMAPVKTRPPPPSPQVPPHLGGF